MSILLNYQIFNPESSSSEQQTPLFILHGLLGSMDNWRSQAKRLSSSRPVITLDLRNHGDSAHTEGMSYREMSEDITKVAQHLNINNFDLLGHSMGGKVAMTLALTNKNLVRQLIIVDIAPKTYPLWHQKILQGLLSVPFETLLSRQEINDYLSTWIEDRTERAFMLKNLKRIPSSQNHQTFKWRCNIPEISKHYLKIAGFNETSHQYPNQTLFIRGENSPYIQPSDHSIILSLFPNAEIASIQDSGHLPHFEQADSFYEIATTFLSPL